MAGNTNLAYRRLCRRFGAALTTTEMVSARALGFGDAKSLSLLARGEEESPCAAQLFGNDPAELSRAAALVADLGFDLVDLNLGCPVPKITGDGGGSALLRTPELAVQIVSSMVQAAPIPVTVKMRLGWSSTEGDAVELARQLEGVGVASITVHGRTREQRYSGHADYGRIGEVASAVSIPVFGNGDVVDLDSARELLATGVAGLAVGRGAMGRPWFFAELRALLGGQAPPPPPGPAERAEILRELAEGVVACLGARRGVLVMRRLAVDFFREFAGAARIRSRCHTLESLEDLEPLLELLAGGEAAPTR